MFKVAHYYYLCGNEIQIFADENHNCTILDKDGLLPICPITNQRAKHPQDGDAYVVEYGVLGLYYKYKMVGWENDK